MEAKQTTCPKCGKPAPMVVLMDGEPRVGFHTRPAARTGSPVRCSGALVVMVTP